MDKQTEIVGKDKSQASHWKLLIYSCVRTRSLRNIRFALMQFDLIWLCPPHYTLTLQTEIRCALIGLHRFKAQLHDVCLAGALSKTALICA